MVSVTRLRQQILRQPELYKKISGEICCCQLGYCLLRTDKFTESGIRLNALALGWLGLPMLLRYDITLNRKGERLVLLVSERRSL